MDEEFVDCGGESQKDGKGGNEVDRHCLISKAFRFVSDKNNIIYYEESRWKCENKVVRCY